MPVPTVDQLDTGVKELFPLEILPAKYERTRKVLPANNANERE